MHLEILNSSAAQFGVHVKVNCLLPCTIIFSRFLICGENDESLHEIVSKLNVGLGVPQKLGQSCMVNGIPKLNWQLSLSTKVFGVATFPLQQHPASPALTESEIDVSIARNIIKIATCVIGCPLIKILNILWILIFS